MIDPENTFVHAMSTRADLSGHLCPCVAMSMARRTGTGEPPSVTLSTSMDFRSGLRLPWRLSMGESTRFLGGSAERAQGEPGQMEKTRAKTQKQRREELRN